MNAVYAYMNYLSAIMLLLNLLGKHSPHSTTCAHVPPSHVIKRNGYFYRGDFHFLFRPPFSFLGRLLR